MTAQRVLIVDDDPDIVHFVRVTLEIEGFEVDTAHDGQSGIDTLLATTPDRVLIDLMMAGMDGITALRQVREHPRAANTSVILLTAEAFSEDRVKGPEMAPTSASPNHLTYRNSWQE